MFDSSPTTFAFSHALEGFTLFHRCEYLRPHLLDIVAYPSEPAEERYCLQVNVSGASKWNVRATKDEQKLTSAKESVSRAL